MMDLETLSKQQKQSVFKSAPHCHLDSELFSAHALNHLLPPAALMDQVKLYKGKTVDPLAACLDNRDACKSNQVAVVGSSLLGMVSFSFSCQVRAGASNLLGMVGTAGAQKACHPKI